jgi:alanine racemase
VSGSPILGRAVEVVLDLDAIVHNTRAIQAALSPGCRLYACLKGDAYGIGIRFVAPAIAAEGVDAFAVGAIEDAVEIRRAGCDSQDILLYPNCLPEAAPVVQRDRLTITISSIEEAQAWNAAASGPIDAFIKIDVGALRAGVLPRQAARLAQSLRTLSRLRVLGAYAHLHLPDPATMREYAQWQFANFGRAVAESKQNGLPIPVRMVSGTAVLLEFPDMDLEAVDPGRALFGIGFDAVRRRIALRPALVGWRARLLVVKDVEPDDVRPHDAPFPLRARQRVGVIPVGWGDGLPRRLPDSAVALVRGKRVRLLPPSHFEHVRVDLTDVPDARYGDEVVLLGIQQDEHVAMGEVAKWMGRDALHLLGAMPRHLSRVARQPSRSARPEI